MIQLRRLFHQEERDPQRYTPLVLVSAGGVMIALEGDAVEEVVEMNGISLQPLDKDHSANDCAEGMFFWNGREVVLLSCERLLLAQERERVHALQAVAQERLAELGREVE